VTAIPNLATPAISSTSPKSLFAREQKLLKAAGEFESMLLSSFWKSMKESFADPDSDSLDPAHDTLEDMSIQAMSDAIGKAGGLGIGKLIIKHLEVQLAASQQTREPQSQ
jgi:Rod binding domain-containing protein